MVAKIFALALAAAATTFAAPASCCMTKQQAQQVATNFGTLISDYSETLANQVLTKNYHDYSESVASLIDSCPTGTDNGTVPLLSPVFTNRKSFEQGQGGQPNNNYQQLDLWYTCDSVTVRWETTNAGGGSAPKPVVGIYTALVVESKKNSQYPFKIDTVYSEFDAAAWLQNLVASGNCPSTACSS